MKAPICEVCLKTDDILCPADEKKLQDGVISELDVKVARLLYKLIGDVDMEFKKAVEAGDLIVIVVGEGDVPITIGKGGKNIKALMRELGKRIRVIEAVEVKGTDDVKKLATDLLYPAGVFGVNIVYKPGGGTYYKVLVLNRDRRKLPEKAEVLESILSQIAGEDVKINFI
ncbi:MULTISPECIES: KH domain-containing protein [Thermococcus]|uniref:Transcription elongation factor NusA n=1 Tax=Thermococcus radiotolerans TaxID=187880 RepID=A0A2Z2N468_9EURY|nr:MULTISPECIES: KH domain-containing protein [Thermococcus]ASA77181.1 transcription elongation factor NusA [Thermococcus sp. 5-4]ASJ14372.1 transcription elongation factor NusA [Thermococcus radiotolerans]NJE09905.1 transcription elongation factor NusA [Thermococcus sp. MAR1]